MALSESSTVDSIEVLADGTIQVRRSDMVFRDELLIAKTYHRHCLSPGDDLSGQDQRVADVAQVVWTLEVVEAYKQRLEDIGALLSPAPLEGVPQG